MTDVTDSGILTTAVDVLFTGGREGYFQALDARTGIAAVEGEPRRADRQRADHLRGGRQAVRHRDLGPVAVRVRVAGVGCHTTNEDIRRVREVIPRAAF